MDRFERKIPGPPFDIQPKPVDVYRCSRAEAEQIAEEIWREKHPEAE